MDLRDGEKGCFPLPQKSFEMVGWGRTDPLVRMVKCFTDPSSNTADQQFIEGWEELFLLDFLEQVTYKLICCLLLTFPLMLYANICNYYKF